ncbi:MAG: RHS repeat-associated core domain-containing protein [Bacteroidales bacterium]|nr:RHS repeat-associated core domain-containing protein [Bacteroidales bacterium]
MKFDYHPDHLGSSSFITNTNGNLEQHLLYFPYGELFVSQSLNGYDARYKFTGKERDEETGYDYFGARYYDSDLSFWLSVDPMSDKYPNLSPYNYTAWNPVILVDPDGRKLKPTPGNEDETQAEIENSMGKFKNKDIRDAFMSFFKLGADNTYEKINTYEYNKFINNRKNGFTNDQIAIANGLLKVFNAGYEGVAAPGFTIEVNFNETYSNLKVINSSYAIAYIGSDNTQYSTINNEIVNSTRTQRFVHEVLGEGLVKGLSGDFFKYSNSNKDFQHATDLQIIQTENIYNRIRNNGNSSLMRSGIKGRIGSHGLNENDRNYLWKIPSYLRTSY